MKIDSKCPATNFVIPTFMRHPQQLAAKGGNICSCLTLTRLYKPVLPNRWNSCSRPQSLAKPSQTAIMTVHICLRGPAISPLLVLAKHEISYYTERQQEKEERKQTMPTVLIDADGCPVVDLAIRLCKSRKIPVLILCDTAHRIERPGAETLVFDKGADSVDFALVNRAHPGDIVITQDYGLASMCLARRARVLDQNGREYTADNMDALLERRWQNKKLLRAGKHPKGPAKRTKEQDEAFAKTLEKLLAESSPL